MALQKQDNKDFSAKPGFLTYSDRSCDSFDSLTVFAEQHIIILLAYYDAELLLSKENKRRFSTCEVMRTYF